MNKVHNMEALTLQNCLDLNLDGSIFSSFYEHHQFAIQKTNAVIEKFPSLKKIPIYIKDNMFYKDNIASAGSKILSKFKAEYSSTLVKKILESGYSIGGRVNMDQFAMGCYNNHSYYGTVYSPWFKSKNRQKFSLYDYQNFLKKNTPESGLLAGGSSGGSAVSVALGITPIAFGTDTGGSVLEPAAFNGLVSLVPTYSAISRYGIIELASELDKVGIFAKTVGDIQIISKSVYGYDKKDSSSFNIYDQPSRVSNKVIGMFSDELFDDFNDNMKEAVIRAKEFYESQGYTVKTIKLKYSLKLIAMIYSVLCNVHAFSNLARYKGWLYGSDTKKSLNIKNIRSEEIDLYTLERIMLGSYFSSSNHIHTLKTCKRLANEIQEDLDSYDVDFFLAPLRAQNCITTQDTEKQIIDTFDSGHLPLANITGRPAMSIPLYLDNHGLPVSVWIIGNACDDFNLMKYARILDDEFQFNKKVRGQFSIERSKSNNYEFIKSDQISEPEKVVSISKIKRELYKVKKSDKQPPRLPIFQKKDKKSSDMIIDMGIEVHICLNTKTKLFSRANNSLSKKPNTHIEHLDIGMPGVFPQLNREAVIKAIQLANCLNMNLNPQCTFDRKHYNYYDLPLGFQITQFYRPIATGGYFDVGGRRYKIKQIHLETDAGKTTQENEVIKLDYNRAGSPLIELVTEVTFNSIDQVDEFLKELVLLLKSQNISNCEMQNGDLRADINISLRKNKDAPYGKRVEIKNLNSFKFIRDAIQYEVDFLKKYEVEQPMTKRYNTQKKMTEFLRFKEGAEDYYYICEGNIPVLNITKDMIHEAEQRNTLTPRNMRDIYQEYIPQAMIETLIRSKSLQNLCESLREKIQNKSYFTSILKILIHNNEILGENYLNININYFVDMARVIKEDLSNANANKLLVEICKNKDESPESIIKRLSLKKITDLQVITRVIHDIINKNKEIWEKCKMGEIKLLNVILGKVLRMNSSLDAKIIRETLLKLL